MFVQTVGTCHCLSIIINVGVLILCHEDDECDGLHDQVTGDRWDDAVHGDIWQVYADFIEKKHGKASEYMVLCGRIINHDSLWCHIYVCLPFALCDLHPVFLPRVRMKCYSNDRTRPLKMAGTELSEVSGRRCGYFCLECGQ